MGLLIYGDTVRSPALRHEIPLSIVDPFLYLESNGTRAVLASSLELPRIEELGGLEIVTEQDLGWDELLASGRERWDLEFEIAVLAVERYGLKEAVVPP